MPIYEYECELCHCRFERKQRFDEEPVAMCARCGGKSRRVIHSIPIIFKGSGFYVTDNRKGSGWDEEKPAEKEKVKEPVVSKAGESSYKQGESSSKSSEPAAPATEKKV